MGRNTHWNYVRTSKSVFHYITIDGLPLRAVRFHQRIIATNGLLPTTLDIHPIWETADPITVMILTIGDGFTLDQHYALFPAQ